jgi:hypothetical protein
MRTEGSNLAVRAVLLLAATAVGCIGSPVSLTAQRGSSILVPVHLYDAAQTDVQVGFGRPAQPGGTGAAFAAWVDSQRGELEFFVDDGQQSGEVFLLRATSASSPNLASSFARTSASLAASQVGALLDVPIDAPLGQQTLRYRNKNAPGTVATVGDIWVLPNQVLLCEASACGAPPGTPVAAGAPTPFVIDGTLNITTALRKTVPDPHLILTFPEQAHAVELFVWFDEPEHADIIDAFEFRTDRSTDLAWTTIAQAGNTYRVKAVATHDSGIDALAIVFKLTGTSAVSADELNVLTVKARDEFGDEIEGFDEASGVPTTGFYIQ